ncbi:two-component response regulator ARR5-like isoform X1 [Sesbania bispinosa]|nr:two-component response regulator ARR5-like isoform X1 [Sesbania bispinosa]
MEPNRVLFKQFLQFVPQGMRSKQRNRIWEVLTTKAEISVTVVESGRRALQYLGLAGENNSLGFDIRKFCSRILNCVLYVEFG